MSDTVRRFFGAVLSRSYDGRADGRRLFRPPSRPLGVLDSRRCLPHPGVGGAGRRARDAGRRAHRSRLPRRLGRALQGGPRAGRQADPRLRGLRRRRPARTEEGLRPPHAPRRDERGLREPDQALLARLPRGLLLQAARRLGAAPEPLLRADRALRLPVRPRLQGARGEPPRRRRRGARPARADLRPRLDLRRAPERAPRRAAAARPGAGGARRQGGAADRRDRRRPLPPPRRRARARGAPLHPVGRLAQEPEPLALRHRPLLLQDPGGDGPRLPGPRGRAPPHARDRRPLRRRDRARPDPAAASTRPPTAATRSSTSSSCARRVCTAATRRSPPSSRSGSSSSSRRSRRWGSPTTS